MRKTTGTSTTRYLWDGDDLLMELDGAGTPVREYSSYPGVDNPFAVRRASDGAVFYYAEELPGHVAGLINTADQVVNTYTYDPWGQPLGTTEQVPQPLRYGAREYDTETGFYYNRARYYDPQLGRFVSEDPIGLAGGINPYGYVGDDPGNRRDPTGLQWCVDELVTVTVTGEADGERAYKYWVTHGCVGNRGPDHYSWQPQPRFPGGSGGSGGGGGGAGGPGQPQRLGPPGPACPAGAPPLQSPVPSGMVTSPFGPRPDPFNPSVFEFHPGLDLRAPGGTAVVAPAPGSITYAGPAWGFLNMVTIRHPGGFTTVFGHVGLPAVALGDSVTGGQIIAYVAPGIAGRSTAPHLHFGLLDPSGAPTNPLPCLP